MGYAHHITRRAAGSDDGVPILRDEWLASVASVGHMAPISEAIVGSSSLTLPSDWHSHRWRAHPQYGPDGPIFKLCDGDVDFAGDDPATMALALRFAQILNAKVVGDEGEEFALRDLVGKAGDLSSNPVNPFTREPVYAEREGLVELGNDECRLVSRRRTFLGLLNTEQRALLHFVIPPPSPPETLRGGRIHVRGSLSEPGKFGSDASCDNVFYVLAVVSFVPAAQ